MIRLTMLFFLTAIAAGCTSAGGDAERIRETGDPYFKCRNAAYVRAHIDICSGILR